MALVNRVLTGRTEIDPCDWFSLASYNGRGTRSTVDELNLKLSYGRLDTRKYSFTVRATQPWNTIPSEIKGLKKQEQFKMAYAKWRTA